MKHWCPRRPWVTVVVAASVLGIVSCRGPGGLTLEILDVPAEAKARPPALEDRGDEPWRRTLRRKLAEPVSVDFIACPLWCGPLPLLRKLKNVNIVLDERARRRPLEITIKLDKVTFANALTLMCSQFDLGWTVTGGLIYIAPGDRLRELKERGLVPQERLEAALRTTVAFRSDGVPFDPVIARVRKQLGICVLFDRSVPSRARRTALTLTLDRARFADVLRRVCRQAGLDYVVVGNAVVISTPATAAHRRAVRAVLGHRTTGAAPPRPGMHRMIPSPLEEPISFDFIATPLDDILSFLRGLKKVNIVADQTVVGKGDGRDVTLRLEKVRFRDALAWITRRVNLQYTVLDRAIFVSTEEGLRNCALTPPLVYEPAAWAKLKEQLDQPVGLDVIATPLRDLVPALGKLGKVKVVLDGAALAGREEPVLTLRLDRVPFKNVLAWICRLTRLAYTVRDGTILISTPEKLWAQGPRRR